MHDIFNTTAAVLYGKVDQCISFECVTISVVCVFFFLVTCTKIFLFDLSAMSFTAPGLLWKIQTVLSQLCILSQKSLIDLLLKSICQWWFTRVYDAGWDQIFIRATAKAKEISRFWLKTLYIFKKAWNIANIETYGLFLCCFWAFWTWQPMINKTKKDFCLYFTKKKGLFWHFIWDIYIYI